MTVVSGTGFQTVKGTPSEDKEYLAWLSLNIDCVGWLLRGQTG